MADKNDETDYSYYYVKNYMKGRQPAVKEYKQLSYEEVPESCVTYIPKVVALPDEIDDIPYKQHNSGAYAETMKFNTKTRAQENGYRIEREGEASKHEVPLSDSGGAVPVKSKKKKKRKPGNGYRKRGIAIVVLTILICATVTLLIADAVSGGYILDELKSVFTGESGQIYYAVETGNYTDKETARVYAMQISAIGGSGYMVADDGIYRVLAEVYPDKKNADVVAARLMTDGYDAKTYEIRIPKIVYESFPQSARNNTKKTLGYIDTVFNTLYNTTVNLAGGKIDKPGADTELKTLLMSMRNVLIEYESNVDNNIDNESVVKVRVQLSSVVAALENLLNNKGNSNVEYLSNIRYTTAMILNTHRALCNQFVVNKEKK